MKVCANGHLYDETKSAKCPYCDGSNGNRTMPLDTSLNFNDKNVSETMPLEGSMGGAANIGNFAPTVDPYAVIPESTDDVPAGNDKMGPTIMVDNTDIQVKKPDAPLRETVGWLIVMSQPQRGRSYQLYPQNNHIGRGDNFIINLDFDRQVSSSGDAIISYNPQNRGFSIRPIDSAKNISFVNDNELFAPCKLKDYDKIRIGVTVLVFRSFCNEEHDYSEYED